MSEQDAARFLNDGFGGDLGEDCHASGCWDEARVRGYCSKHYQAARAEGKFGGTPCSEWPCEAVAVTRGYCSPHYHTARRDGTLPDAEDNKHKQCPGDGEGDVCWGVVKARGLCNTHYVKWYRNKKKEVRK